MKIVTSKAEWFYRFRYATTAQEPITRQMRRSVIAVVCRWGKCPLRDRDVREVVCSASCDSRDQFVKEKGRRLALRKAVQCLAADKNERREFWAAYLKSGVRVLP